MDRWHRSFPIRRPVCRWEAQGLTVTGDRALVERFVTLFELPSKTGA
jgi:hypothetical protein